MWVSSKIYFILIICCVEKNNLRCIIICYCDIKLRYKNCGFIKIIEGLSKNMVTDVHLK